MHIVGRQLWAPNAWSSEPQPRFTLTMSKQSVSSRSIPVSPSPRVMEGFQVSGWLSWRESL